MIILKALAVWLLINLATWAWLEWGPVYVPNWMTKDLSRKKKT